MGATASKGIAMECCAARPRNCCDLNNSICGEDAFYRDAFYDCEEGNGADDPLFEQARLKMRKGSVFADYASFEFKRHASQSKDGMKMALAQCMKSEKQEPGSPSKPSKPRAPVKMPGCAAWLGATIPEWSSREFPLTGEGPYWSKGDGNGLRVRCGPDYKKTGNKKDSTHAMYEALFCDAIKAESKIENIIGTHVDPTSLTSMGKLDCGDVSGGNHLKWTNNCPVPRIICINMMMPYQSGIIPFKKDGGCSFVGLFEIKPETIKAAMSAEQPAHVRLLQEFFEGPAGTLGGPNDDPDRCLAARLFKGLKKDQQAGLFKAVAKCINPEDVNVPEIFNTYNGKPCLITKCGYIIKDPAREWMEIGIDVRGFNVLARKMLGSFRSLLPRTKIHYGFMIQGVEDEELPEGLLCDMYVHGVDMISDPLNIDNVAQ